ncbi:acid protease [Tothia fuscella]|uniref:Acid protease n=1 Tax=Tothia fuscella TaxID=1048955 RepID=A0A9P4NNA4_9PEZI|nr:acid protease [Tothia fuscella]
MVIITLVAVALSTLFAQATVLPHYKRSDQGLSQQHTPAMDQKTDHYMALTRGPARSPSAMSIQQMAAQRAKIDSPIPPATEYPGPSAHVYSWFSISYHAEIQIADQCFFAIIDTGSAQTWIIQDNFTCFFGDDKSACGFGPGFKGDFSTQLIPNAPFEQAYGSRETIFGAYVHEPVSIAGITVADQIVGLGDIAIWRGDNITSGIIGLAFPSLSNYTSQGPSYSPLFTSMVDQNHIPPTFSLALDHDTGGYIAFGGLPPVGTTGEVASAPMEIVIEFLNTTLSVYAINADALVIGGTSRVQTRQYIVDSGTTLSLIPFADAEAYHALFSPPAKYNEEFGLYEVDCNASPPALSIRIGGVELAFDRQNALFTSPSTGLCYSLISGAVYDDGFLILGSSFLTSVVAVFDVRRQEMRFANQIKV